jgi:hypothetical protein
MEQRLGQNDSDVPQRARLASGERNAAMDTSHVGDVWSEMSAISATSSNFRPAVEELPIVLFAKVIAAA